MVPSATAWPQGKLAPPSRKSTRCKLRGQASASRTHAGLQGSLRHEEEKSGQNNVERAPHFLCKGLGGKDFVHLFRRLRLTKSRRSSRAALQPKCHIFSFSLECQYGPDRPVDSRLSIQKFEFNLPLEGASFEFHPGAELLLLQP